MTNYYNENNPHAAQWLRNLIAAGHIANGVVDERSIMQVRADELTSFAQCHFFAGIGGWSYALRQAGWPDDRPVWTGSCPCQPFSEGGKRHGFKDKRDLWPRWEFLITKSRPAIVFGEQVASSDGVLWASRAAQDLEASDYAFGAAVLPAVGVGAPHRRDRFYFIAHALGSNPGGRLEDRRRIEVERTLARPWTSEDWNGGFGRYERLADGLPGNLAKAIAGGFGNAIVPELAAEFIVAASQAVSAA
jgi:DNA (cytosine-5)-methyltransferase 1